MSSGLLATEKTIGANRKHFAITTDSMQVRKQVIALIALWGFIYLAGCGYPPPLLDDADTVHAEAAREIVETGDWVTLHVNKIRYLEKAPLMYWSAAVSYKLFGVSEFSSRLPIAACAQRWRRAMDRCLKNCNPLKCSRSIHNTARSTPS